MGGGKKRREELFRLDEKESVEEEMHGIPPPQTPKEPMEYLSRSWSLSASEINDALHLATRQCNNTNLILERIPADTDTFIFTAASLPHQHHHKLFGMGRWFHFHHHKNNSSSRRFNSKEKARAEGARIHAAVSVARVAAAIASVNARMKNNTISTSNNQRTETDMSSALASATELLASHCIEIAEQAGASHQQVASAFPTALDVRTPGDLITLTAAAATALRGATAFKTRVQREPRNNAAVIPYGYEKSHLCGSPDIWCKEGELLKRTTKGSLHWKKVSLYVNKKSQQVIVKLKGRHLGGALSKKKESVVYGVYEESRRWQGQGRDAAGERCYFGLRTTQGVLEFECEDSLAKQRWVDGVQNLLRQVNVNGCCTTSPLEHSLELLKLC